MSNYIYVVEIQTGEYDDKCITSICAFYLEEDAVKFVKKANDALKKQGLFAETGGTGTFSFEDENYFVDYTGAEASYYALELRGL